MQKPLQTLIPLCEIRESYHIMISLRWNRFSKKSLNSLSCPTGWSPPVISWFITPPKYSCKMFSVSYTMVISYKPTQPWGPILKNVCIPFRPETGTELIPNLYNFVRDTVDDVIADLIVVPNMVAVPIAAGPRGMTCSVPDGFWRWSPNGSKRMGCSLAPITLEKMD